MELIMKKIILTGGGTAGHVAPNIALIPSLKKEGYEIFYIGSHTGIEKELIEKENIPYFGIASGKLRRYKSVKNFTDILRVSKGFFDAMKIIRKIKPDVVFSKGGFVVVPVIAAAKLCKVKSVIHESDMTPGLANRLAMPFASKVCTSFPETLGKIPADKGILTGSPLRAELFTGSREKGLSVFATPSSKPVLLVTGGSTGAKAINEAVRNILDQLLEKYRIIHLCGRGNLSGIQKEGYKEFEYLNEAMKDVLAAADIVISRAGANSIFELTALKKPNLLIPLTLEASRGDQIQNAASFKAQGLSAVLEEKDLDKLLVAINDLYQNKDRYIHKMNGQKQTKAVENIIKVIGM